MKIKLQWILFFLIIILLTIYSVEPEEIKSSPIQLQQYKTIYFLAGKPDTKIQLSFKVQLINKLDLYFAYTQLMMWDVLEPSAPFRDLNYNPDLFYRIFIKKESNRWVDIGIFEHESNGRDGESSRGWNRAYVLFHSTQKIGEHKILWSIKSWFPYSYKNSNPDLPKYRGLWEFQVTVSNMLQSFWGENELNLRLYPGGNYYLNPIAGGQELLFISKTKMTTFAPNFLVGFFHGYGENLIDYNRDRFGIRAGLSF